MDHKNLKITAEHYDIKVTIELTHAEANLTELLTIFKSIAMSLGYQQESWNSIICDAAEAIQADLRIID